MVPPEKLASAVAEAAQRLKVGSPATIAATKRLLGDPNLAFPDPNSVRPMAEASHGAPKRPTRRRGLPRFLKAQTVMGGVMQIDVSPEIAEMRVTVRAFVKNELPAWADAVDESGTFSIGLIEAFARQGFLGMRIAEEYGGAGLELAHYCMVQEEISRAHTMSRC